VVTGEKGKGGGVFIRKSASLRISGRGEGRILLFAKADHYGSAPEAKNCLLPDHTAHSKDARKRVPLTSCEGRLCGERRGWCKLTSTVRKENLFISMGYRTQKEGKKGGRHPLFRRGANRKRGGDNPS